MKFISITINNMFSYYGPNTLQFSDKGHGCNVTVLMGRNGFGKTSFINCIKMLFIDSAEEIRRTVQRKRVVTEKQFIQGVDEWWGVLNQKAKQEGEKTCSVSAVWLDDEGSEVSAKRQWNVEETFESSLTINHAYKGKIENPQALLEQTMPTSFMSFFFFDGEDVQAVAEGTDSDNIKKMELLLNIKPLEHMKSALHELRRSWKRQGNNETVNLQLNNKERELAEKDDERSKLKQDITDLTIEIEQEKDELKRIDRHIGWLRGGVSQTAEITLKANIDTKEENHKALLEELALGWKGDSFLAVHPKLASKAIQKLESLVQSNQGDQEMLIDALKDRFTQLFTMAPFPTPRLSDQQASFYNRRILKELDVIGVMEMIEGSFDISHDRGVKLNNQLSQYSNLKQLQWLKTKTNHTQQLWRDIGDLNNKLQATGKLSDKKQQEHESLQEEKKVTEGEIRNLENQKGRINGQLSELERNINKLQNDYISLEKELRVADQFRQQSDFALKLIDVLEKVKSKLKIQKRKELEQSYNKHLKILLDSHTLIHAVKIDEHFQISYWDKQSSKVPMSSISAGMKQLSATALLWALKETSGRELPVIIDTPMGRIDAQHQRNLLTQYYPHVAEQVILLPTDSELDERNYQLLEPYVCQKYYLENPSGMAASIKEKG